MQNHRRNTLTIMMPFSICVLPLVLEYSSVPSYKVPPFSLDFVHNVLQMPHMMLSHRAMEPHSPNFPKTFCKAVSRMCILS